MGRYGYPPSHRNHRAPQPEVCEVCGLYIEAEDLLTLDIDGLRGVRACHLHDPWRTTPTGRDIRRQFPGVPGPKFVGQGRVFEPGDDPWWFTDPIETLKLILDDGDVLLVADDLSSLFTTWTDKKSGVVFTVNGSSTMTVVEEDALGGLQSVIFNGSTAKILTSSGVTVNPVNGLTVVVVAALVASAGANDNFVSQASGSGTGREWIRSETDFRYRSKIGGVDTVGSKVRQEVYQVIGTRIPEAVESGGDLIADVSMYEGGSLVSTRGVSVESNDGQLIVAGNPGKTASIRGRIAAAVIALSDLGHQAMGEIAGALTTYYSLGNTAES